jgi:hypothetical protein
LCGRTAAFAAQVVLRRQPLLPHLFERQGAAEDGLAAARPGDHIGTNDASLTAPAGRADVVV